VILHLDMDAFYASVEARDDPRLAGLPLIVGHPGRRGVVMTCSYEARRFGVRSAMPSLTAARLCPEAVWVPCRMERYAQVSSVVRGVLDELSPLVEPVSIDEAFVDLTGIARDLDAGIVAARRLKERIREEERLSASVGVAPNKFLAKVASDLEKPDGCTRLSLADVPSRLWPLAVERLWGVGPKTAKPLRAADIDTVGAVLRVAEARLAEVVGERTAAHLRALARGEDDRVVSADRDAKSISEERTYGEDLNDPAVIDRELLARAEGVARQLRRERLVARTVRIKVRTADYTTWIRARTLAEPTDLAERLLEAARETLRVQVPLRGRGVRLLGLGVANLEPLTEVSSGLFDEERARRAARAADLVRAKLGDSALTRARLMGTLSVSTPNEAGQLSKGNAKRVQRDRSRENQT
jgi:DNA polymerase-4